MYKVLAVVSPGSDVSTTAVMGSPNRRVSFSPVSSIASYETSSPSDQFTKEEDSPISDSSEINLKRPSFGHAKEPILWTDSVILYLKKYLPGFCPRSRNILSAIFRSGDLETVDLIGLLQALDGSMCDDYFDYIVREYRTELNQLDGDSDYTLDDESC